MMVSAAMAVSGGYAFQHLSQAVAFSSSTTFGSRTTIAVSRWRNAPLCCTQRPQGSFSSIFNDKNEDIGLAWDPYLGEVTANEKIEEPPQYVPPPPIPAEDICIRDRVEFLMYNLKRILPGQLDKGQADVLCSMLSATVEVQNPAVCFRGSTKCLEWLKSLIQLQASVNLQELYYENDMKDPEKRSVYAVWTVRFLELVRTNPTDLVESTSAAEPIQLSGETMFEMEESGLVTRVTSTWYILQEDNGASFTRAKNSLFRVFENLF